MIAAVLLAAGKSERMGKFKQLMTLDGKTFVETCADNLVASRVGEVIVVTGYRAAEVRAALGDRPVQIVENPDFETGMGSSIKRGVESVASHAGGILIALADQPLIATGVLNQIIAEYDYKAPLVLIPTFRGRRGHPIILNAALRQEIASMDPKIGLKQVTEAHRESIHYIEVGDDSILIDFDLPGDLEALSRRSR